MANLADLAGLFTRPGVDFRETLNEMLSHPHDPDCRYNWRNLRGLRTSTHPVVSEKAQEMLDQGGQGTLGSPLHREDRAVHSIATHWWPAILRRAIL